MFHPLTLNDLFMAMKTRATVNINGTVGTIKAVTYIETRHYEVTLTDVKSAFLADENGNAILKFWE